MNSEKRLFCFWLILVLLVSFLPATVFAEDLPASLDIDVTYRDFHSNSWDGSDGYVAHPDFETTISGILTGMVNYSLGGDGKPVLNGSPSTINSETSFNQWYENTSGVNKAYGGSLTFNYDSISGNYVFEDSSFFPLDGESDLDHEGHSHNYHFTMELHKQFQYVPGQIFEINSDDDLWLFINHDLVIDLGGIHPVEAGSVNLDLLGLTPGEVYDFDLFFAERHTTESNFLAETNIVLRDFGEISVCKYYDMNGNGSVPDASDLLIPGWKIQVFAGEELISEKLTDSNGNATFTLPVGHYIVKEVFPLDSNWMPTTATSFETHVTCRGSQCVKFGNVYLGCGGGKTPGFWSNKNGAKLMAADDLAMLAALNLRDKDGNHFDPANYNAFRKWLLNGTATNMAYMLSVQLAAMELNVYNGLVDGSALIHVPGNGFMTVNEVMVAADTELGLYGLTLGGDPNRSYQATLKDALDYANNNLTFLVTAIPPWPPISY